MTAADPQEAALVAAATEARGRARCPFSGFAVGCALRDTGGTIWTGANVENASYTLGLCAERVALFYALTHGAAAIEAVAVVTGADVPTPPCGACRQILFEFAADADLVLVTASGALLRSRVRDLLPLAFDASFLAPRVP
ncbi:cytidine deaminase [Nannocystis exedens]|uniref:Cytidine deaminase n=1 Tax=Nannocystis exedens TaxID=54 RepID=A0A1I1THY9_9BACT|nr:cytidine deaminase [Nannocystis exedens]PCC66551.1 cytidine deaminase [Nannocystis exedens]SFD58169.1 cytidine deaminase [Nannocystis exedens]